MVERCPEKAGVGSSILPLGTTFSGKGASTAWGRGLDLFSGSGDHAPVPSEEVETASAEEETRIAARRRQAYDTRNKISGILLV